MAAREAAVEREVSRRIGAMPFLWLSVPNAPTAASSAGSPSSCARPCKAGLTRLRTCGITDESFVQ